ncbi:MAG: hypothetical protein ABJC36_00640 [Gemmatimonadales bacterium]
MSGPPEPRPPWHTLLAPVPPEARPVRKPIGPPEILASAEGAAIAGWQNLSLNLSGAHGLRHLLIVLDETGRAIAASDHVFLHWPDPGDPAAPWQMLQESIGGRLEADGRFLGTCWTVTGPEPEEDEEPAWTSTPRPPTDDEVAQLRSLVAELIARAP